MVATDPSPFNSRASCPQDPMKLEVLDSFMTTVGFTLFVVSFFCRIPRHRACSQVNTNNRVQLSFYKWNERQTIVK